MKYFKITLLLILISSCIENEEDTPPITNTEILPGKGLGELTFANTGTDIISTYGEPRELTLNNRRFVMWYESTGLAFLLDKKYEGSLTFEEIHNQRYDLIDYNSTINTFVIMKPFQGVTPEGIQFGSTRDEVTLAYGMPSKTGSLFETYDTPKMQMWYGPDDLLNRIDLLVN